MDDDLLMAAECYFGGGTAVVLTSEEYRESVDIDFMCASQDGYRLLRENLGYFGRFDALFPEGSGVGQLRDIRADQYGIRTMIEVDGAAIKLEIVREGRIALKGRMSTDLGVPVLDRVDQYAEKLLANSDRWADRSVNSRDILDLSMMQMIWGPIPEAAWEKARSAYGSATDKAYEKAVQAIRDPNWLKDCLVALNMGDGLADPILALHDGPLPHDEEGETYRPGSGPMLD